MPFVTVGVFHDQKRKFVPQDLNTDNVNAIDGDVIEMWGPDGASLTQKVTMAGAHFYVDTADIPRLKK